MDNLISVLAIAEEVGHLIDLLNYHRNKFQRIIFDKFCQALKELLLLFLICHLKNKASMLEEPTQCWHALADATVLSHFCQFTSIFEEPLKFSCLG